ncbi:N-acetylglucosamine kinase [Tomitella gaofuii]|uniref:N-acetylglucosamine kinase n=1 Tax=Tomitella gaofuii TaxID=2760083 RepID=UPI0015FE4E27|nr:BadF/BadG/BcrA/BcrD ATPase family protein [Tomitella gaofuii]
MTCAAAAGIDIGGSTTRMLVVAGGRTIDAVSMPSAGLNAVGADRASAVLQALAGRPAAENLAAVCVGSAGADDETSRAELLAVVRDAFPGAPVRVVHDAELVLEAGGEESGVVLISGTGSVGWARNAEGRQWRAGGWGPLLGDEGSAYAIALDAIRAVLADVDRGRPQSTLSATVLDYTSAPDPRALPRRVHARPERAYWAALAERVLDLAEVGDPGAREVEATAVHALVRTALRVSAMSGVDGPVLLAGGVLSHARAFADAVVRGLADAGMGPARAVAEPPVLGAVRLAERMSAVAGQEQWTHG